MTIASDLTLKISLFTNEIEISQLLANLSSIANDDSMSQFVEVIAPCSISSGNRDFVDVLNKIVDFGEPSLAADQQRSAYVDSVKSGFRLLKEDFTVIPSVNCYYLVAVNALCKECKKFTKNLSTYHLMGSESHLHQSNTSIDSATNIRYLNIKELKLSSKNLQLSGTKRIKEAALMAIRLSKIVEGDGLRVSSDNHESFKNVPKKKNAQQNLKKVHHSGLYGSNSYNMPVKMIVINVLASLNHMLVLKCISKINIVKINFLLT